jgi:hypothetical protein
MNDVDEEIYTQPPIPKVEFITRDINDVVKELKIALKEYADSIELVRRKGFLDENGNIVEGHEKEKEVENVISLRGQIKNIIESFDPNNEQNGIFDDIIALLPETQMEQLAQAQQNILSETDQFLPINPEDYSFMERLAKNFVLGKAGVNFAYKNRVKKLDEEISRYLPKIVNKLSIIPGVPNIDFESLNNFFEETKSTPGKIISCNQNMFNDLQKSVSTFFGIIKNTADQLWNMTPTEYQHEIWGDRSQFVNKDGTLVDPVEQVRLDLIKDMIKQKYCGKSVTVSGTNPYTQGINVFNKGYRAKKREERRAKENPYGGKSRKRVKNTHKNKKNRQRKNKTRRRKNKTKSKK